MLTTEDRTRLNAYHESLRYNRRHNVGFGRKSRVINQFINDTSYDLSYCKFQLHLDGQRRRLEPHTGSPQTMLGSGGITDVPSTPAGPPPAVSPSCSLSSPGPPGSSASIATSPSTATISVYYSMKGKDTALPSLVPHPNCPSGPSLPTVCLVPACSPQCSLQLSLLLCQMRHTLLANVELGRLL